jgi:hypothetical protein
MRSLKISVRFFTESLEPTTSLASGHRGGPFAVQIGGSRGAAVAFLASAVGSVAAPRLQSALGVARGATTSAFSRPESVIFSSTLLHITIKVSSGVTG